MIQYLVAGFVAGFVGSMPVAGPIAVLVVARSLQDKMKEAMLIGWGAALPEAGYAFLATWGFAEVLADQPAIEPISRAVAALILVALAIGLARYRSPADPDLSVASAPSRTAGSFALGFTIAALNPTLIITWTAVIGIVSSTGFLRIETHMALPFSAAAALGMGAWCALAAFLIHRFRSRLSPHVITGVHRVMAFLVGGLAIVFAVAFFNAL